MSDAKKSAGGRKVVRAVRARATRGVAERVRAIIEPYADELGYAIWDVEYVREGADYILRVTIDSDDGITIDDCERMTRAIDPVLDEHDPIEDAYLLEVSSPGIERELTRPEHFEACAGERVEVRLYAPVDGSKVYTGILRGLGEDGNILIECGAASSEADTDNLKMFPRASVTKIKTLFEF